MDFFVSNLMRNESVDNLKNCVILQMPKEGEYRSGGLSMTNSEELKRGFVSFAKNIAEKLPVTKKNINEFIQSIENDAGGNFSMTYVIDARSRLAKIVFEGLENSLMTIKELEFLAAITDERVKYLEETGSTEGLAEVEKLCHILGIEIRSKKLAESAWRTSKEFAELIRSDPSIMDPGAAIGIYSGFIELADGKKPDEIPDLAGNLRKAETILKLYRLQETSKNQIAERMEITGKLLANGTIYNPKRIKLAKEILASKVRRLERRAANYKDVEDRKNAKAALARLNMFIRQVDKQLDWNDLDGKIGEYLSTAENTLPFGLKKDKPVVGGIFNAE